MTQILVSSSITSLVKLETSFTSVATMGIGLPKLGEFRHTSDNLLLEGHRCVGDISLLFIQLQG